VCEENEAGVEGGAFLGEAELNPSARRMSGPGHNSHEPKPTERKFFKNRNSGQNQNLEHTKKNSRFRTNTIKMQTRNFSKKSEQGSHPIRGGLRPPSLFLISTRI
jgi:hypothetical protein